MEEVRDDQAGAAESRIAAGDGRRDDAEQGEDAAQHAEPALRDLRHHDRGRRREVGTDLGRAAVEEEVRGDRRPDQGDQAFRDHRAVEDGTAELLGRDAAGHQRALGGVEAAHGAAGDGDEQAGEDGLSFEAHGRAAVLQALPEFGQGGPLDEEAHHQRHRHEQQGRREHRIDPADDLVDRQERRDDVIGEDDKDPGHDRPLAAVAHHAAQDDGRAVHEHGAHHQQEEDGEDEHDLLGGLAQVAAHQDGIARPAVPDGEHAGQVVMDGAREDAAEDDPQVGRRAELRAHDGAEDGPGPGDVQELDHVHFPRGHRDEVHVVGLGDGRRHQIRIGAEHPVHERSVQKIADDERGHADQE